MYVSNGVYRIGAPVSVTKPLTVLGVFGAGATVIDGGRAVRGVSLAQAGAVLRGFTVRNGRAPIGGGIHVAAARSPGRRVRADFIATKPPCPPPPRPRR